MFEAKVVEDSIGAHDVRLTTLQLTYPRYIHAEMLTHRVFSRNASSSRAVPVAKLVEMSLAEMVEPIRYGKNQAGMQASKANLEGEALARARAIWRSMAETCAAGAKELAELGLHKQWANRPTEWFGNIRVLATATEWDNFFELRDHPDAQPEIRALAQAMLVAMGGSNPAFRSYNENDVDNWHLPYVTPEERLARDANPWMLAEISAARCARVSYLTHDGQQPDMQKDKELFERLAGSRPLHASPTEHQGVPMQPERYGEGPQWCKNFRGWFQFRQAIEDNMREQEAA
jgi:thymidylate synthase ThyX